MADVLIVDEKKVTNLKQLKDDIADLAIAEAAVTQRQSETVDEAAVIAAATQKYNDNVTLAQNVVTAINLRLTALKDSVNSDPDYSAAERTLFANCITNKEYA
jgi:hypothetical protein